MNLRSLNRSLSRFEFTLFTTVELCEIAGYPPGAAPRLARALRANGNQTVPRRGVNIRRLIDQSGRALKKCKVWFIPVTDEAVPTYLLEDVASVRRHFNRERSLARVQAGLLAVKANRGPRKSATTTPQ